MSTAAKPPMRPIDAADATLLMRLIRHFLHNLCDLFDASAVQPPTRPIEASAAIPPARHIETSVTTLVKSGQ